MRYFLPFLAPVRPLVVGMYMCSLAAILCRLPASFIPQVFTQAFPSGQLTWLISFIALATLALIVMSGLMIFRGYLSARVGEHLMRRIRQAIYGQLERLSMASVGSQGAGQFVQRLARDVFTVRGLFTETLTELVTELTRGIVLFAILFWHDPLLTLALTAVYALVIPVVRRVNRRLEALAGHQLQLNEVVLGKMVESVGGFRDILASGRFDRFARQFDSLLGQAEQTGVRTAIWGGLGRGLPSLFTSVLVIVPYAVATQQLASIEDFGRVVTYVVLLMQVMPVFQTITGTTSELALASPSLRQLRALLEEGPHEAARAQTPKQIEPPIQEIRFDQVSLDFGPRRVLDGLSFHVPGGQLTAIVGQSGSGKTTIFHLLLRLLRPSTGRIVIDEADLDDLELANLRRLIGFIPQNPFIFQLSLRENLLIAAPDDVTQEQLDRAVDMAQLRAVVERREDGLDSPAGYMGASLSAGERQRIALARLILQDPAVIVCDEYTANIDVQTTRLIQEQMTTHFGDRTRVVITHELYTIRDADHIVVLDDGRVTEGTHQQLLGRPGLYRDLWEVQSLSRNE